MIEKLLNILKDGEWHDLIYLSDQTKMQSDKLTEFLQFLSKKGIITYKNKTHRIKIKPEWQNILSEETELTLSH